MVSAAVPPVPSFSSHDPRCAPAGVVKFLLCWVNCLQLGLILYQPATHRRQHSSILARPGLTSHYRILRASFILYGVRLDIRLCIVRFCILEGYRKLLSPTTSHVRSCNPINCSLYLGLLHNNKARTVLQLHRACLHINVRYSLWG